MLVLTVYLCTVQGGVGCSVHVDDRGLPCTLGRKSVRCDVRGDE